MKVRAHILGGEKEKQLQVNFSSWAFGFGGICTTLAPDPCEMGCKQPGFRIGWAEPAERAGHRSICPREFLVMQPVEHHPTGGSSR